MPCPVRVHRWSLGLAVAWLTLVAAWVPARAGEAELQRYVVIVANNRSVDGHKDLQFADDDGVLYHRLFAPLAVRVDLLAVLDDETQRRFPDMVERTQPPTRARLQGVLQRARRLAGQASQRPGVRTELIFVYVGHGAVGDDGKGFVYLADGRYTRADLFHDLLAPRGFDYTHLILDACHAFSLVAGRGDDGGDERATDGLDRFEEFLSGHDLEDYPGTGVLFATNEDRETHEWSAIRAGVFSHLVRSALCGAADVNGDGRLEYSEVAAFVDAASVDLARIGRRMVTFAWPPARNRRAPLLDLRQASTLRHLVIGSELAGKFHFEDEAGSRIAEFHKAAGPTMALVLPAERDLFFRSGGKEQHIPAGRDGLRIELPPSVPYTVQERGAVDRAFERGLFTEPYTRSFYRGYVGSYKHLVPVQFDVSDLWVRDSVDASLTRLRLELDYLVAPALLVPDEIEHGAGLRLSVQLTEHLELVTGLEAGYAPGSGPDTAGILRLALVPGITARWPLQHGFDFTLTAELGWVVLDVHSDIPSTDYSVGMARARAGLGYWITGSFRVQAGAGLTGYLITLDEEEEARGRAEFLFSVSWMP